MQPRGRGRSRGGHLLPLTTHIQLHSRPISAPPSPFHFTQTQSVYDQRAFPAHSHYPMPPHSAPLMGGMPHMPPSPLSQPPYGNHSIVYHERLGESQQSLSMPVSAATPRGQAGRWSNEGQLSAGSVLNQNTGSSTNHPLHAQSRNGRGRGMSYAPISSIISRQLLT